MEKLTWNELASAIAEMPEEVRNGYVSVAIDDNNALGHVTIVERTKYDVYVHKDDDEDCGDLELLKAIHDEDFNIDDYKLSTKQGTPYLYIDFDD